MDFAARSFQGVDQEVAAMTLEPDGTAIHHDRPFTVLVSPMMIGLSTEVSAMDLLAVPLQPNHGVDCGWVARRHLAVQGNVRVAASGFAPRKPRPRDPTCCWPHCDGGRRLHTDGQ